MNNNNLIKKSYIDILKFASTESYLTYQQIFDYINNNNIRFYPDEKVTESSALLKTFFITFFRFQDGSRPVDVRQGTYQLS